jgi:tRNA nucleotidyltransferase/poly(A) polymerase
MPDYIYLLANRLSPSQQSALQSIRDIAREAGMTVFLTGGAVRDLTSGSPVRDLDVSVQGDALTLKAALQAAGAVLWGEHKASSTVFARFPGSVRVEVSSTRREEFPKPGKPVYHPGSILEDLRRRDFTANAMALSLNEGSYGLLMDPLNGVADLEARLLRLVSNYGFLEDPIRLIRAARLQARMGWELEEKTKVRFENAREEGVISLITPFQQGYEVEEIVHEEDGLKILKALEADGWMKALFPAWTSAKVDVEQLDELREVLVQLQMQGVNPDASAAQAQILTAKLPAKDLAALKKLFSRQGFVHEWETQDERAKEVGKRLTGKEAATPSAAWKLITAADPEAVLWLGLTSKSAPVQEKFKDFFTVWPDARQRIPYALMQEMRIVPELEGYQELVKSIFFELIDGKLTTDEEMRRFLEPHSPPAPPPPVTIKRTRAKKGAKNVEAREVDEDDPPTGRSDDDEDSGEDLDESEIEDERGELIARSAPQIPPPPPEPVIAPASFEPPPAPTVSSVPVPVPAKPLPAVKAPVPAKPVPASKAEPEAQPKPAAKAVVPSTAKSAPAVKSKIEPAKAPVKVEAKPTLPKPVEAKSTASKAAPTRTAGTRAAVRPLTKPPVKTGAKAVSKSKPPLKKSPAKKAVVKAAAKKSAVKAVPNGKLRKVVKTQPAKVVVKKAAKSKPALKKAAPKVSRPGASAKKKR